MLITVNIGNTNVVIGVFKGDDVIANWRLSTEVKRTTDEYMLLLNDLFSMNNINTDEFKGAIIGSVVPHLGYIFKSSIKALTNIDAIIVDGGTPLPLKNLYENPLEVGVDRLANAVGGKYIYGAPLIVADFGTATTLDVISKEGDYLGGVILPGAEMSADALFKKTSMLPRIFIEEPKSVLGRNTAQSMKSGLIYGLAGAVDSLIDRLWEEIGYKTDVVATGGIAPIFSKVSHRIKKTNPLLTLIGLKVIWASNRKEKKDEG